MRSTVCCRWYDRESMPHLILFVYGIVIIIIKLNVKKRRPVPHVRMSVRVCDVMCYISPSRSIDCGRTAKCANDIGKKNICTQLNGWAKVKMIFIPSLFTKVYIYSRPTIDTKLIIYTDAICDWTILLFNWQINAHHAKWFVWYRQFKSL